MADEAEEGGGGAPAGGGGSVLKKYGPLAAIVLLAQVVLAWVVITVTVGDKAGNQAPDEALIPEEEVTEGGSSEESTALPFYYTDEQLSGITANPAGTNAQRYAVLTVELGLVGEQDGEPIKPDDLATDTDALGRAEKQIGLVRSIILQKLRSSDIDDLENNLDGILEELKQELNRRVFDKIKWDDDGKKKIRVQEVISTALVIQ